MANPILEAFQWGAGGAKLTPEQVARQREIAASLMQKGDPAFHNAGWLGAIGRGLEGAYSGWSEGRANRAETEGRADLENKWNAYDWNSAFGGSPSTSTAMATAPAPDYASARVAQAHGDSAAPAVNLSESKQAFISNLLPAAIEESKRTGVDPRIIVAQAAQETGWGRSAPGNNYFGIKSHGKGGGQSLKTHEYVNGNRVNVTDSFRRFDSPADSVRGYGDFILQNPRYRSLREAQGLDAQLAALQASGYATDPNYSKSVGAIARGIQIPDAVAANEAMASGSLAGLPVAETPQDVLAQEAAMAAQDPMAFQKPSSGMSIDDPMLVWDAQGARMAPSYQSPRQHPNSIPYSGVGAQSDMPTALPEPRMVNDMPVADIAQSLTRATVNPDLPMAGNTSGFLPVAQSLAAQPQQQGGMPNMQQLIELASDPWATDAQRGVVQALLQQQMQAQDPYNQARLEKLRLETEALRNPAPPKPVFEGGQWWDTSSGQPRALTQSQPGFRQLSPQEVSQAGLDPNSGWQVAPTGEIKKIGGGGVNVSVGGNNDIGTIPPGMKVDRDAAGNVIGMSPIPGGPAWQDEGAAAAQRDVQTVTDAQKAETTLDATRSVLDILDKADTPATGTLSRPFAAFSGTPAGRVRSYVGTLQSGVALGAMQRLKEASATGATGFGALSAPELNLLINDIGALDPDNTEPDIFRKTIERIQDRSRRVAEDIAKNVSPERIQELGLQGFIDGFSGGQSSGVTNKPVSEMTDEELEALANGNG